MKTFKIGVFVLIGLLSIMANAQDSFPSSWEGHYKGELEIYGVEEVRMKLTMKLDVVKKTDSLYTWKMTYDFQGKEDVRDYELKVIDTKKGHYLIDEKNSILLDGYFRTDRFTSFFSVNGAYIITTYIKNGDELIFDLISGTDQNTRISGGQLHEGNEIPEVTAYPVNARQKAVLKKL